MLGFAKSGICGEMSQSKGDKLFRLFGGVGEMSIESIPPAPGVDVEAIKKGDADPLEVVVEIPIGKSKRGWNYTKQALKDIVDKVNTTTLNGILGHQKAENVSNEFIDPVTHWIGAKMTETAAYFRGIVDQDEPRLKRNIRTGRIKEVSIFGRPTLARNASGETDVINYDAMSIDWTPLDRPGMPTSIVAMSMSGEMWDPEYKGPTGEMKTEGNDKEMEWAQIIADLKQRFGNKTVTIGMIAGEIGISEEQIVKELTPDFSKKIEAGLNILEAAKEIGITGEMSAEDVKKLFVTAKQAIEGQNEQASNAIYGEMMTEKVTSEAVREQMTKQDSVLGRLWSVHKGNIPAGSTKEVISGEMDKFLSDPLVKSIVDDIHTNKNTFAGGNRSSGNSPSSGVSRKRASI